MQTKSALASTGVWGGAIAFLTGAGSFIHSINITGLAHAIADNWPAIVTAGAGALAAWGRIRASTFISPPAGTQAASSIARVLVLSACLSLGGLGLPSCAYLTSAQKTAIASAGSAIGSQIINAAANLGLAKLQGVLPTGSPYASAAANGLRTLQGTTLVTSADIQTAIASFGDPNQPEKWNAFGNQVGKIVTHYGTTAVSDTALEAAAIALNQIKAATPTSSP